MKSLTKLFLGGSALAVVGLLIGAAVNTVSYLPGLDVANDATFHGNVTIGGVSHNAWPAGGSAIPGTLVTNGASATAGSLVKFGSRITNVVDASSADVQQTVCDTNKFWIAPGDGSVSSAGTVSANGGLMSGPLLSSFTSDISYISMWGDSLTEGLGGVLAFLVNVPVNNAGVSGENSTQIQVRAAAATNLTSGGLYSVWAGANGYNLTNDTIIGITNTTGLLPADSFKVLAVIADNTVVTNSALYNAMTNVNWYLKALYGTNFIDVRALLRANYDPGTPQDVTDIANDVTPSTLRSDTLHLNAHGYYIIATNLLSNWSGRLSTNFIPNTTDHWRSHSSPGMEISSYGQNTILGSQAGASLTYSNQNNVFIGLKSGSHTKTNGLTAIGYKALQMNTNGINDTAVGTLALQMNTTGYENTAVGGSALNKNTSGLWNTAVGLGALQNNTTYSGNTAVGDNALGTANNEYNTAVGAFAMEHVNSGTRNCGLGWKTLDSVTSGSFNSALGFQSGYAATTGSGNTFIGYEAGRYQANGSTALTTPTDSVYIGKSVLGFDNSDNNTITIGAGSVSQGANSTTIGNSNTVTSMLFGYLKLPNMTVTPTGAQLGGVNGSALWSSNCVFYYSSTSDGTTVITTKVVP